MALQREFKQKRAAATFDSLVAAAARVFARRGFEAAQTPEIAAEAGVSTGALYRYFKDKRVLFVEVVAQHLRQSNEAVLAKLTPERFAAGGANAAAAIDLVIDVLFERVRRDAGLERVYLAMSFSDPEVMQLRADYEAQGILALARLIDLVVAPGVVADSLAAARVIGIAAVEVAADRAGLRSRTGDDSSDEAVKTALREMTCRYLFPANAPPAANPPATAKRTRTKR
ncbi:MAG TPA: helix-turn-helix domain-containing protein [Polyangia bacterium]|jgi:AcrR family transcriptional regulator|nr:helix-turn-helix domain-containing protein [Polyangia bacterium]